jgi:hypothetical protein
MPVVPVEELGVVEEGFVPIVLDGFCVDGVVPVWVDGVVPVWVEGVVPVCVDGVAVVEPVWPVPVVAPVWPELLVAPVWPDIVPVWLPIPPPELDVAPGFVCEPLGYDEPVAVLVPACEPLCVPEVDGDVVLEEEELEGDAVVEFVWLVLLDDVLPGVVCATTHVAHESSTAKSAVLLFISVLRRWIYTFIHLPVCSPFWRQAIR